MKELASHYRRVRSAHPEAHLVLVTDIDGTILDMRHMVCAVLKRYDREHGTSFFRRLKPEDVTAHENQVEAWLETRAIAPAIRKEIHAWYIRKRWEREAMIAMHAPFRGVIEVLRWFQLQPNTEVALLTGRPESLREQTLRCLEAIGSPRRVHFSRELLLMNPGRWEENVANNKARGIEALREAGMTPFAFIDNEPSNLQAVRESDPQRDILLLHADTIFESKRSIAPPGTVAGHEYRIDQIVDQTDALPRRVELVWHGANTERELARALEAPVQWVEIDVRMEPTVDQPIVRASSLEEQPWAEPEEPFYLECALATAGSGEKGLKLDIKGGVDLLARVLDLLDKCDAKMPLWFNARLEDLGQEGFAKVRKRHPKATLQCPADWLMPFIFAHPETAKQLAEQIRAWGIDRFSFVWDAKRIGMVVEFMEQHGFETNLYRVPDLEAFLHAAMLLPTSITTSFRAARPLL